MIIKVGDTIPKGDFTYIPYTPALADAKACGIPGPLSTDEWKDKKVVLVSVPGAFTPTCHVNHIPPFVQKAQQFKDKGVDVIAVLAANDPFVMSAWGRVEGFQDQIIAISDSGAKWSKSIGLEKDLSDVGFGLRTGRYALIIDKLVVTYVGVEPGAGVSDSGADAVLAKL
jgi:alkyl hydroperoxide reductase 1